MKSLKVVIGSLAVTIGIVVLSSFAVKNYDSNAFVKICYEYVGANPAAPAPADIRSNDNWEPVVESTIPTLCPLDDRLCVICFENTTTSFAEAREVLIQYLATGTIASLPDGTTINGTGTLAGKSVQVFQKQ